MKILIALTALFLLASCTDEAVAPIEPIDNNDPPCEPRTCEDIACGAIDDGCGGQLACGSCPAGQLCEGNMCIEGECTPQTCEDAQAQCGILADGCGGLEDCGICPQGDVCDENLCIYTGPRISTGHADRSDLLPQNNEFTTSVALADLNQNGRLDIIWANQPLSEVDENAGVGLMVDYNELPTMGNFRRSEVDYEDLGPWTFVTAVDVDQDGYPDVIAVRPSRMRRQVTLFRNDGSGILVPDEDAIPEILVDPHGLAFGRAAAGDLTGNGRMDLVIPVAYNTDLTLDRPNIVLINQGAGVFAIEDRLPPQPGDQDYTLSVCVGDFTGDGNIDIHLGQSERVQNLLVNDGTGTFTDETADDGMGERRIPEIPMRAYECLVEDFDGDGHLDIAVVSDTDDVPNIFESYILYNDGNGYFRHEEIPMAAPGRDTRTIAFGDVTGDGAPEIVLGHHSRSPAGGPLLEFLGRTSTGFTPLSDPPEYDKGISAIALGDLDGDGRLDIVIASTEQSASQDRSNILLLSR